MKVHQWLFEADDTRPSLIDIGAVRNLCEFLSQPAGDVSSVHSAHFKRHHLATSPVSMLQKPIGGFLSLHPPHDAPATCAMSQDQTDRLGAILSHPVSIVLLQIR